MDKRLHELPKAIEERSARAYQQVVDPHHHSMLENRNNTVEEDVETSAWLRSAMEDPFLRELCADLFFNNDTSNQISEGPSGTAPFDTAVDVALGPPPKQVIKLKDEEEPNEGCGAGSSSSAGSGTSGGVKITKEKTIGGGRKRKGRETVEECYDVLQSDEENEYQSTEVARRSRGGVSSARRSRTAEVHNMSERRRRDRINEKMKALQELIPHSNKNDKASMLEEAIEYLKSLQLKVQMTWIAKGIAPVLTLPDSNQHSSFIGETSTRHNLTASNQAAMASIPNSIDAQNRTHGTDIVADMHYSSYPRLQETSSFGVFGSQSIQSNSGNVHKWHHI